MAGRAAPANERRSTGVEKGPGARWYNAVWRWHFYAGLFCIPFVIWLALTGAIYLWRPRLEAWLERPYDRLQVGERTASPHAEVEAALRAVPGSSLRQYVLPKHAGAAVRVIVTAGGVDTRVYVDPHTRSVLHVIDEDDRPFNVVSRLHGTLLAGRWGRARREPDHSGA